MNNVYVGARVQYFPADSPTKPCVGFIISQRETDEKSSILYYSVHAHKWLEAHSVPSGEQEGAYYLLLDLMK
jgi:hypothetical protein